MSNDNLKREEAAERARLISGPLAYEVALDLSGDGDTFGVDTTIRFGCREPGASTFVDLDAAEVHGIELNGSAMPPDVFADSRIRLDGLAADNALRVRADCRYSRSGTGLHRFRDPVDDLVYSYTQFEPFDAHRVYPCFDQPDLKGTFAFGVNAGAGDVVISNMPPAEQPPDGQAGRWRFDATPVMSTYITALCVGPFEGVHDHHRGIDLGLWCRGSLARYLDPEELFEITKQGFDFYEELFDQPYPFGPKYDQVFCPEYKFGAMENAACVTFAEGFIYRSKATDAQRERRAEVILHEMAHMWFGDLVTMRWWDDLWLNESFATYMAFVAQARATRFHNAWSRFASGEKGWAYRQDQLPSTHPILADIPDAEAVHLNFDGITYAKGASVLKQLVAWVGEDAFFDGMRRYFKRFAWANTELTDFLGVLEEASGRDLHAWSKDWLETAGVNAIHVAYEPEDGRMRSVQVGQTATDEHPTIRPHRIALGLYTAADGTVTRTGRVELDVAGDRTPVAELEGEPVPDLLLPNDDDLTYTKIRLDDRSLATLEQRLRDLEGPLARTLCWSAAWEMVRDAELAARNYQRLVLANIDGETDVGSVSTLTGQMNAAAMRFGDPANRDAARRTLAEAARTRMHAAEPGSDLQLVWARLYIGTARTPEWLDELQGLLDGSVSVPGLAIDTDVRWAIVFALASAGTGDELLIDAEVERDPTDQGRRYAALARASRPLAEAKQDAWQMVTTDDDATTSTLGFVIGGFQQFDQEPLLEPFVEPYFQTLLPYWERRGLEYGLVFANGMYPSCVVRESTVAATDAYLERTDLPPPVRRVLLEGRDQLLRQLRARAKDAAAG